MPRVGNAPKRLVWPIVVVLSIGAAGPALALGQLMPADQSQPPASSVQTFSVELSSAKAGKRGKPVPVGLTFKTGQTTAIGSPRVPLRSVIVEFPRGVWFMPEQVGVCTMPVVRCTGVDTGPAAVGRATFASGDTELALDTGASFDDRSKLSIWAQRTGSAATTARKHEFPATWRRQGGHSRFTYEVPATALEPGSDLPGEFTSFSLTFKKRTFTAWVPRTGGISKEKHGLIQLAYCPEGGSVFEGTFTYADGSTKTLTSTVPCKNA